MEKDRVFKINYSVKIDFLYNLVHVVSHCCLLYLTTNKLYDLRNLPENQVSIIYKHIQLEPLSD